MARATITEIAAAEKINGFPWARTAADFASMANADIRRSGGGFTRSRSMRDEVGDGDVDPPRQLGQGHVPAFALAPNIMSKGHPVRCFAA